MWHERNMGVLKGLSYGIVRLILLCWLTQNVVASNATTMISTSRNASNSATMTRISAMDSSSTMGPSTTMSQPDFEMIAMQRWKNAEKLIQKATVKMLRNFLVYASEEQTEAIISQRCLSDLTYLFRGLAGGKFWAYRMLDASSHIPSGIISGTLTQLGDFQSCLSIDIKKRFKGKFCSLRISPMRGIGEVKLETFNLNRFFDFQKENENDRLLQRFLRAIHPYHAYFRFRISLCVPSSCNGTDVISLVDTISKRSGLEWEGTLIGCNDEDDKKRPYDGYELMAIFFLAVGIVTSVIGTSVDIFYILTTEDEKYKSNSGTIVKFFLCFSFVHNTKRLLKKDDNPESIKFFHGMKSITIFWVILNHTYNNVQPEFTESSLLLKEFAASPAFQVIINGYVNVDTFFFITGVILVYARMVSKDDKLSVPMYLFRRVWRLGPSVFFVTVIFFIVPRFGDGPVWDQAMTLASDSCKRNWWANLLYINNFFKTPDQCILSLWYVAADMQLCVFALIVLIPIRKRPKLGLWILGICSFFGIGVIIFNQLYFDLPPSTVMSAILKRANIYTITELGYYPFYVHAIVTCIGMATGYFIYKWPKFEIPLALNILGWVTAMVFGLSATYGLHQFNYLREATTLESVTYAVGSKIAWGVALSWVTIICFSGNGGYINKFLSWNFFVPISRLTYSTYLVHVLVMVCIVYNLQTSFETRHRVVVTMYIGFSLMALMTAYLFSQMFESPFQNLEKLMFSKRLSKTTVSQHKPELTPEDILEGNKTSQTLEYNRNGARIPDINKLKIEYKTEINSSNL